MRGRNALVTGASKGVGRGIAVELARRGVNVAVNYHADRAGAEETAREIRECGAAAVAIAADIAVNDDVERMFERAIAEFGRLDILVNNAGVQTWAPLLELSEAEWDRVIDTNLKGCFLCTQRAGRYMKDHGGGRIVNIGSGCNRIAFPKLVNYTASK